MLANREVKVKIPVRAEIGLKSYAPPAPLSNSATTVLLVERRNIKGE